MPNTDHLMQFDLPTNSSVRKSALNINLENLEQGKLWESNMNQIEGLNGATCNHPDWFFPDWAVDALNTKPIRVKDTDSALGRYNVETKEIGLMDLARIHGHLCDGLVIAFVQLGHAFTYLFEGGVVDRTDLRVVSKNGPCWVDVAALLTGARINFQTLRIEAAVGNGFIVQRVSTGQAVKVGLAPGVFPEHLAKLEFDIRRRQATGATISPEEVDEIEFLQNALSRTILTTPVAEIVDTQVLDEFVFQFSDMFGTRGDILNRHVAYLNVDSNTRPKAGH